MRAEKGSKAWVDLHLVLFEGETKAEKVEEAADGSTDLDTSGPHSSLENDRISETESLSVDKSDPTENFHRQSRSEV